jgi:hypothetical protein
MVPILFTESLDVRFAVRIKELLAASLRCRFEFGRCDVPVHSTFLSHGRQVLAEIFHSGPAEEPIAVVESLPGSRTIPWSIAKAYRPSHTPNRQKRCSAAGSASAR